MQKLQNSNVISADVCDPSSAYLLRCDILDGEFSRAPKSDLMAMCAAMCVGMIRARQCCNEHLAYMPVLYMPSSGELTGLADFNPLNLRL